MKVMVTGFEAFGTSTKNATEEAVKRLQEIGFDGVEPVVFEVLLVAHSESGERLLGLLSLHEPDVILCLGEAGGRSAFSLEKVALNYLDFRIPDNQGFVAEDEPVLIDGPVGYFSTLPLRAIKAALSAAGIPAEISLSAGSFLCNEVFYTLMDWVNCQNKPICAGFIHVPILPEIAAGLSKPIPSMATDIVVKAVAISVDVCRQAIK